MEMEFVFYALIIIFGTASYIVGVWQMLKNKYLPNTFSRVIWVLLSINSFVGVLLTDSSDSSILLGAIFLLGNIVICIVSFWKGISKIGKLEYYCLSLLLLSGIIWIFFNAPLINLVISLIAHFIGGIPTYKKVWINPKSESFGFWSLFFIASVLSVVVADTTSLKTILFPMYFVIFDGMMSLLTLRGKQRDRTVLV